VEVCVRFTGAIGLPVDDVLARSDLYEQPAKIRTPFSIDLDRAGDVCGFLENVVPGPRGGWASRCTNWVTPCTRRTPAAGPSSDRRGGLRRRPGKRRPADEVPLSHPYVLRAEAHILTTEGIAMRFERFAQNVDCFLAVGAKVPDPDRFRAAACGCKRNRMLVLPAPITAR
jgi:peptidyl-dipeptidase A